MLGPVLFLLYINVICNMSIGGQIVTYADHTCLIFSSDNWFNVKSKATAKVNKVFQKLSNIDIEYK